MAASSKSSNPLLLVVFLALSLEVGALFFRSEAEVHEVLTAEREELVLTLGDNAAGLVDRADEWFKHWFVQSGVMSETMKLMSPAEATTEEFETALNESVLVEAEDTGRSVWTSVYLAVHRIVVALVFLPLLLIFSAASLFDGWQQRKIKILGFAESSPQTYGAARFSNAVLLLTPLLYVFAPVALPIAVVPVWATLLGLGLQTQTAHVPRV